VDGRDYHFLTGEDFARRVDRGEFLEHVSYVSGHRYGTLLVEVDNVFDTGRSCVLELETKGAKEVEQRIPDAVSIFVQAPSFEELERRLRERATESAGEIGERLALARAQIGEASEFDHVVTNDDVERAVARIEAIVDRELAGKLSAR
jgi:guanylate kinase